MDQENSNVSDRDIIASTDATEGGELHHRWSDAEKAYLDECITKYGSKTDAAKAFAAQYPERGTYEKIRTRIYAMTAAKASKPNAPKGKGGRPRKVNVTPTGDATETESAGHKAKVADLVSVAEFLRDPKAHAVTVAVVNATKALNTEERVALSRVLAVVLGAPTPAAILTAIDSIIAAT